MRAYARKMVALAESVKEMEKTIRKAYPTASPSAIRKAARDYVMAAYREASSRPVAQ